ncbi:MAG: electron transfer flavoprotein subunit alpha/FixB family protein [Lentisphaeria bacterium]
MWTPNHKERATFKNIWVIGEFRQKKVQNVTFELLGAARQLAEERQGQVWCILIGHEINGESQRCIEKQADTVLILDHPELALFRDELYSDVLGQMVKKYKPEIVLFGATAIGRSLAPRTAVELNCGLTADCTGLTIAEENGDLLQTRPAFGGNIMATIKSSQHRPQMATVRPRVMSEAEPDSERRGRCIREEVTFSDKLIAPQKILQSVEWSDQTASLGDSQIIIAGGRGVQGPEGFQLLKELAKLVGGAVGASRAAVDAGWIDYAYQIGQTGQTVQPSVYMACGVSGQIQHLVGMQSASTIIAINKDPDAPIMQLADYAVIGDLFDIIPVLMKKIQEV